MNQRSFLSILCLVLINLGGFASVSAQTCIENRKNFIPNGTYDGNRRLILSSLPSNAAGGFYNGSIGQVPNRVYAVGMCIPQADANDCSACIEGASDWLIQDCTNQTDAYYWALDPTLCLVRYANTSFSGSAAFWEITPQYLVYNTADINSKNVTEFKMIWEGFIHGMIAEASASRNHYKADVAALTPFQNMYALMQCTPDISSGDCDNCLRQSVIDYQSCCAEKTGGYVMRPICFFRWQMFTFSKAFGKITLAPPPSPPSLRAPPPLRLQPPSSAGDRAKTTDNNSRKFSVGTIVAIAVLVVFVVTIILGLLARVLCWRRNSYQEAELNQTGMTTVRSLKYKFETIEIATDKFSQRNKIGEGGFGEVYKGTLRGGQEIAVKKLKIAKRQGEQDFKNEVLAVANLQHRNLVRLLGYSVRGVERILVYEYVPNKTLDYFLFDPRGKGQLDWTKRYNIIKGITRGVIYLHQDSHHTVIHCDLKPANILLDARMNPKICDFGLAKIFGTSQSVDNPSRMAGTHGYVPPEHNEGSISRKTDVYSFGVLVLEIICGRRTMSFNQEGTTETLVTHGLRLWRNGSPLDLVDSTIADNYPIQQVTRCIHIALLCVQLDPDDRPDMSKINQMLTSNTFISPDLKAPGSIYYSTNDEIVED